MGALVQVGAPNDDFVNAISIPTANTVVTGSNEGATKEPGEPDHARNCGGKSVWWTWQATEDGFVTLSTQGSTSSWGWSLDTLLAVYVGSSVSSLSEVASNDEDPSNYCASRLGFRAVAGTLYYIAVDGYAYDGTPDSADEGTIELSIAASRLAENDNFAQAIELEGTRLTVTGNNESATKEPGEPNHAADPGGKSIWWKWRAPEAGYATLSIRGSQSMVTGSDLIGLLAVYVGNSVSNLTPIAQRWGKTGTTTFRVEPGTTYRIAVDGSSDNWTPADCGLVKLSLSLAPNLPAAPAWGPLPDIYGGTVQSADFDGKVVVLNFWATWCSPCVEELPGLVELYQKYASQGLVVVGISLDNGQGGMSPPTALVGSFAAAHGLPYPVGMDRPLWTSVEAAFGGIAYIPSTFIIDRQNHIIQQYVGSDGHIQYAQWGKTTCPVNLWAVTERWRKDAALCRPR